MLLPPPFPISVDQLDTAFLGAAVDLPVTGFTTQRIGADRGMLGEIFVLDLDTSEGTRSIVAKFAALREEALTTARQGRTNERELRCYDELLATTPVRTPACHGTWYDPETAHFCLLQDLVETDTDVDQVAGLTAAQAALVIGELAPLHARWWGDDAVLSLDWLPRLDGPGRTGNLHRLVQAGWAPLCELMGDDFDDAERRLGDRFADRLADKLRSIATLPSTLIHSDLRADNLLFAPDGSTVSLVDWQGCGVGPPGFDLAYLLSSSLPVDVRREHEADLLDEYRSRLASHGVELTADEVRAGYGEAMHYGLAIGCALPVISDPDEERVAELARTVTRRSIEALRDHGQLWET